MNIMLRLDVLYFESSLDTDQLASEEARSQQTCIQTFYNLALKKKKKKNLLTW